MPVSKKPRKQRPLPTSAPHREQQIGFLDKLYTRLMLGHRATQRVGDGAARARKRLAAKKRANMDIPSSEVETRQRRRRSEILRERQALTKAKRIVAQENIMGGPARIRSLRDIEKVLG